MYDLDQTIELLERAVTEKGHDHIYVQHNALPSNPGPLCRYVESDGTPGCIIGYVLSYVDLLDGFTYETEGQVSGLEVVQSNFTQDAIEALFSAQVKQDMGKTWGEALAAAKEEGP